MDPSPSSSPFSPASITITVKTTSGTSLGVQICPATETVSDLKSRLASELNIFADQQQLVFAGRELTSGLLSQYNLQAGSTVTLALAMHSGPLYAAKRTSLFGKQDLSAILRTLTEEQIAFLLSQKRPVTVTTKVGDQLVVFTLMPSDIDPSVDPEDPETPTAATVEQLPAAAAASASHNDPASVQTASFPVTSKPLPVPKQKSPVMAAAEATTTTTTATPSDAEPTAAPEFSTLMVNERDSERQVRRRHHHHHHHHHHRSSSSKRSSSSSSCSSSSSSCCSSPSCSSSSSSSSSPSSSPSSTAHLSSQERLKEHRRRREAHREAHREQKRKNEALRIKVAFLLEQLREKRLGQEEVTTEQQQEGQQQPLTWVSVEPMEMSQLDEKEEEVFTEPSTPAPEPVVSEQPASPAPEASLASGSANRCFKCSKKLGLATTFKCKCDHIFCAAHRWESSSPDSKDGHCCSFDFKSHGRQLLRDSNPLVKSTRVQSL